METDTFTYDSPDLGKEVRLMNLVARFRPKAKERILFGAHWDSRPWADKDPNPAVRTRPILGANDGASGVAVLLEVARVLRRTGTPIGVDLVLFDGGIWARRRIRTDSSVAPHVTWSGWARSVRYS